MALPVEINPLHLQTSGGYSVSKSLRFRNSASANLSRTLSVAGNRKILTVSTWVKWRCVDTGSAVDPIFSVGPGTSTRQAIIGFNGSGYSSAPGCLMSINQYNGSSQDWQLIPTQVFRDPSAWYHIVVAIDTTQATASNRVKLYVNGSQVTSFSTANYPTLNSDTDFGSTSYTQYIGRDGYASASNRYYDGYIAEFNYIDGQALTPSSFGAYDLNGVWQPAKYSGTYGTNGFYLPFTNTTSTATLGNDFSGNSNTWTVNNISLTAGSTYDSMTDSPTVTSASVANYCVLNPVALNPSTTASTLSDGNLTASASAANSMRKGTFGINSGAWYFEATLGSTIQGLGLGEVNVNSWGTNVTTVGARTYYLYNTSTIYSILPGADTGITSGIASGGTLAVAVNYSTLKLWLGYAASGGGSITWVGGGNPASGTTPTYTLDANTQTLYPLALTNGPSLFVNFGQRPFTYTAPTGFNALNTYNLPTPAITNGAQHFAATLWTGTGSNQTINNGTNTTIGTTFQPDFVWDKARTGTFSNIWTDSIRGVNSQIFSDNTAAAEARTDRLQSINSNGFTVGTYTDVNQNGTTFVGWQWKGGGSGGVSNTNGSITSTVSANTTAGFSVVKYTATGSNATVGHGLGVALDMYIVKNYASGTTNWPVYHSALGPTKYAGFLNDAGAGATSSTMWNNTAPTSSVFSVGSSPNLVSGTTMAYCWAAVPGYSAFGSYTGNGSADGPFVYTGFRPRFIMVKNTSISNNWAVIDTSRDTYNGASRRQHPNLAVADNTGAGVVMDILSNGFKCRNSDTLENGSGNTIIYAAFAENPFNSSRAR